MYRQDRELYYKHLLAIYKIPSDLVTGWLNGQPILIDTYTRIYYSLGGQAIGKFRH